MATSLKSRVIVREHSASNTTWAGTYSLLIKAKSIPSPIQEPNTVESTTLEDDTQTFELGINASDKLSIDGNMERSYLDSIAAFSGKQVDIIHLYGTDGLGGVAKYAYTGQVTAKPNDVGGNDEILGMTAIIVPNTVPEDIFNGYTVTESNGTFTVTATA